MSLTSPINLHNCNKNICNQENFQFTFDRTETSQALKITNKHYYRRVHKVANEVYIVFLGGFFFAFFSGHKHVWMFI
jgi:hypothetical protein